MTKKKRIRELDSHELDKLKAQHRDIRIQLKNIANGQGTQKISQQLNKIKKRAKKYGWLSPKINIPKSENHNDHWQWLKYTLEETALIKDKPISKIKSEQIQRRVTEQIEDTKQNQESSLVMGAVCLLWKVYNKSST